MVRFFFCFFAKKFFAPKFFALLVLRKEKTAIVRTMLCYILSVQKSLSISGQPKNVLCLLVVTHS